MESVTFWVKIPDKRLNPNNFHGNTKWAAIARTNAKKESRNGAEMIVLSAMQNAKVAGGWKKATVEVKWYAATARKLDRDNARAMLKGVLDGCTRAGLWIDDTDVDIIRVDRLKDATFPRVELVCTQTA